jgi:hypothetical protein
VAELYGVYRVDGGVGGPPGRFLPTIFLAANGSVGGLQRFYERSVTEKKAITCSQTPQVIRAFWVIDSCGVDFEGR